MEIKLGSLAKDLISDFEGIATARVEYLNGCVQFCLTGKSVDNKKSESLYFDKQQLIEVKGGVSFPRQETGGPSMYCRPV